MFVIMRFRRSLKILLGSCLLILSITVIYLKFALDHPNMPKATLSTGYYSEPISVELIRDRDCNIYYTLDGSIPTEKSLLYTEPIVITNRSNQQDILSRYDNLVKEKYYPENKNVDKGTVIRAICVNRFGNASNILTNTYFVGIDEPKDEVTVSIVADKEDLFGKNGIYVTGAEYDTWFENGKIGDEPELNFFKNLEAKCDIEIFINDQNIVKQNAGLQIQGSGSRYQYIKRFAIVSRTEYSGSDTFDGELFDGIKTHSIMLKNTETDAIIKDLFYDRDISTQDSRKCKVFLNGEYMYDAYIMEKYDKNYFYQHYGAKKPVVIKCASLAHGEETEGDTYFDLYRWIMETDFSDERNWEELNRKIDIQSYIDNTCIQALMANWDYEENGKNYMCWRTVSDEKTEKCDGKWRWCIYDMDILPLTQNAFRLDNPAELNTFTSGGEFIDYKLNETVFYNAFKNNDEYKKMFVNSYMDIVNNNFSKSYIEKVLEDNSFDVNWDDGFLINRVKYATDFIRQEFGLCGKLCDVSITSTNKEGGSVKVNTSYIDLIDGEWIGKYYSDYPIEVVAYPAKGYEFVGWSGDVISSDEVISLRLEENINIKVKFRKIK